MNRYVQAAIDSEIGTLRTTASGRACAAFRAAAAIGGFVGSGEVDRATAMDLLLAAALETGLPAREALGQIRRGVRRGETTPRHVPTAWSGEWSGRSWRPSRVTAPAPAVARQEFLARPPEAELDAMWAASVPAGSDPDARVWFGRRYAECAEAYLEGSETWDLCRVVPRNLDLPRWARSRDGWWNETGHRLLFRLWDDHGQAVSVRARALDPATAPKSLAPAGYSVKGLVLADPLGVQILAGRVPDWWEPREVVIAEGEPDWLLWAARQRESDPQGPALLGVESGSWSQQIADRIPDGTRVAIRTHGDQPGERYALQIVESLCGRCRVYRSRPGKEGASK